MMFVFCRNSPISLASASLLKNSGLSRPGEAAQGGQGNSQAGMQERETLLG